MNEVETHLRSPDTLKQNKDRSIAALVCGIVGLVLWGVGFILSIIAWRLGHTTLAAIENGHVSQSSYGSAKAGKILGIIGTILLIVLIPLLIILTALGVYVGEEAVLE